MSRSLWETNSRRVHYRQRQHARVLYNCRPEHWASIASHQSEFCSLLIQKVSFLSFPVIFYLKTGLFWYTKKALPLWRITKRYCILRKISYNKHVPWKPFFLTLKCSQNLLSPLSNAFQKIRFKFDILSYPRKESPLYQKWWSFLTRNCMIQLD